MLGSPSRCGILYWRTDRLFDLQHSPVPWNEVVLPVYGMLSIVGSVGVGLGPYCFSILRELAVDYRLSLSTAGGLRARGGVVPRAGPIPDVAMRGRMRDARAIGFFRQKCRGRFLTILASFGKTLMTVMDQPRRHLSLERSRIIVRPQLNGRYLGRHPDRC